MGETTISCIIIDDDPFSSETLKDFLLNYPEIQVLKCLNESYFAIKHLAILKPDIAFLDINMPQKNGISILNEINDLGISTKVIFITAHQDYLMDALKKNAFDYILKPLKKQELDETIKRYINSTTPPQAKNTNTLQSEDNKLIIQNGNGTLILEREKIAYIEADGCYTKLYLTDTKTEVISKNIGKVQSLFPDSIFFKISRSCIINTSYLNRIDRLRRNIHLCYNNNNKVLKASKEPMYDLERFIHKKK